MSTLALVFAAIVGVFFVYAVLAPTALGLPSFMQPVNLPCPHHSTVGRIRLDGLRAALTNAYGQPQLRVAGCTLLGHGESCDEACLQKGI